MRNGGTPDHRLAGIRWKACLIVSERSTIDPLVIKPSSQLICKYLIDELLR